jgi:hypothetical protein
MIRTFNSLLPNAFSPSLILEYPTDVKGVTIKSTLLIKELRSFSKIIHSLIKVKLSLQQDVEAHTVVRCRGSQIF